VLFLVVFQRSQRLLSFVDRSSERVIQFGVFVTIAACLTPGPSDVGKA